MKLRGPGAYPSTNEARYERYCTFQPKCSPRKVANIARIAFNYIFRLVPLP